MGADGRYGTQDNRCCRPETWNTSQCELAADKEHAHRTAAQYLGPSAAQEYGHGSGEQKAKEDERRARPAWRCADDFIELHFTATQAADAFHFANQFFQGNQAHHVEVVGWQAQHFNALRCVFVRNV